MQLQGCIYEYQIQFEEGRVAGGGDCGCFAALVYPANLRFDDTRGYATGRMGVASCNCSGVGFCGKSDLAALL